MKTRFIYIFIAAFFYSCNNSIETNAKKQSAYENAEDSIISIIFNESIGPDTLWTKHRLISPELKSDDELSNKNYKEYTNKLKLFLDTAKLYVFLYDSLIKYPGDRNCIVSMLDNNNFKLNFPDIDTSYCPLIYKLVDSTEARMFDIRSVKTKYKYNFDYIKNKKKYHDDIVIISNMTFSRVVFNIEKTKACVYFETYNTSRDGTNQIVFLRKVNRVWKVICDRRL